MSRLHLSLISVLIHMIKCRIKLAFIMIYSCYRAQTLSVIIVLLKYVLYTIYCNYKTCVLCLFQDLYTEQPLDRLSIIVYTAQLSGSPRIN